MTNGEIIATVDELEPNQYSTKIKLQWLSILDGKIINDIIKTHLPPPGHRLLPHWPNPLERDSRAYKPEPGDPLCAKPPEKEGENEESEKNRKPPYHSEDDILVIPDPYGTEVYSHYLQAMIASENSEIAKYNQQMTLFNNAYQEFCDFYNRTCMPAGPRGGNRVRF